MRFQRAYRVALAPTNVQATLFRKSCGAARWAYNWGLQRKEDASALNQVLPRLLPETVKDPDVLMALEYLPDVRVRTPTAIDLHKELVVKKGRELGWMYEVSKCAPQEALRNLDRAYINFFEGRGRHPSFKSKKNGLGNFTVTGNFEVTTNHITLPRVGRVRFAEKAYVPPGHYTSATVSEKAGRWYVSVRAEEEIYPTSPQGEPVGVDLGITTLATISDRTVIPNPKALRSRQRKLKHLQKEASRKQKGSHNRRKANRRTARCHARIADVRRDAQHKATTWLARTKPVIVVETLQPLNMMKNHPLAQAIADASWGEFVRQLDYKCRWYGSRLIKADSFFPSTKKCSSCGNVKDEMSLKERTYRCDACGFVMDRDLNASRNLAMLAVSSTERINACGRRSSADGNVGSAFRGNRNLTVKANTFA